MMHIIPVMALVTGLRQVDLALYRLAMTGITMQALMRTIQREFGLLIVIELPDLPGIRIMAQLAVGPQPGLMDIVTLMAFAALLLGILIGLVNVAIGARGQGMHA